MARRFELVEGASSKFWQIELEEKSFTVTFGRIGTNGQAQVKSFDTEEKAKAEHDKLVKEKVKKGYGEVGAAETIAKPKPPAPTKTIPSTSSNSNSNSNSNSTLDTDARIYQQAAPVPASGRVHPIKSSSECFKRVKSRFDELRGQIDGGLSKADPDYAAIMKSVIRAYGSEPESLDLKTEAAAYRLLSAPQSYQDDDHGIELANYWVSKAGVEFAVRAIAMSASFGFLKLGKAHWAPPDQIWLGAPAAQTALPSSGKEDQVWIPVRRALAAADPSEISRVHAIVAELRAALPLPTRALVDAALGDAAFARETAKELVSACASAHQAPIILWPVLFSLDDASEIVTLLDRIKGQYALVTAFDRLPDVVVRLGADAAPVTGYMLTRAIKNGSGTEKIREAAAACALVRSEETARYFAKCLDNKDLRPIASEYLQSAPELSIAALAEQATLKGAAADLARTLLVSVVGKARAHAAEVAQNATPAQKAVLESALERFENLEDAAPNEISRVLADPPWLSKKEKPAPIVVRGLVVPKRPGRVAWVNAEHRADFSSTGYEIKEGKKGEILTKIRFAIEGNRESGIGSQELLALPKKECLAAIMESPLFIFSWHHGGVPNVLLGRYEADAIPAIVKISALDPLNGLEALALADSVDVAPVMADALVRIKKCKKTAEHWLRSFPETAAIGLVPIAVGELGKQRNTAAIALRFLANAGKEDAIKKAADEYAKTAPDVLKALDAILHFDPLYDFPFPPKTPKLPPFIAVEGLARPRIVTAKRVLSTAGVEALATICAAGAMSTLLADHLRAMFTRESLAELSWEIFSAWLVAGAPSKEAWAFTQMGFLGDDGSARKLTPLVRAWPGEAAHARAVLGLDVLAQIGTDVALMHLHGIAQKLKFKGLQEKAREKIDEIAEARGLSAEELADRLVPDLDLDDDGTRILDFGERKFRVTFDETLKPNVLDDTGKRLPDLPKPKQTDDAEKSKEATEIWKALKKDAKTVASGQLLRLEIAMCKSRRWPKDVFDAFLLEHPLLIHIVRRVVWGTYGADGALLSTFRVAEDKSLADVKDAQYTLPEAASIGIVHRLEMKDSDAGDWGQVFGDYEIMQPFEQLSRETRAPEKNEATSETIERVKGLKIPTGKVLGLDARGWRRGPPQDGGVTCWYEKALGGDLVVCLDLDPGIYTGMISESPEQTLGACVLSVGGGWSYHQKKQTFGTLSPVAFSELVRDLESLRP